MGNVAGPPAPRSKYDNIPAEPLRVPQESGRQSLVKSLLPLLVAQGVDLVSTEKPFGFLTVEGMHEGNQLPGANASGFGGTAGRAGWGLAEAALVAALMRANPRLGGAAVRGTASNHLGYAIQNKKQREELEGKNSAGIPWRGEDHW